MLPCNGPAADGSRHTGPAHAPGHTGPRLIHVSHRLGCQTALTPYLNLNAMWNR
jgi:hypothetical protein